MIQSPVKLAQRLVLPLVGSCFSAGFVLKNMSRVVMVHLVEAFGAAFSSAFASAFHVSNAQS